MDSDDLLEALNLNGSDQNSGDNIMDDLPKPKEDHSTKRNSSSNKPNSRNNKPKPKRKSNQRPLVNIDELLDGIDINDDNNNNQTTPSNAQPNSSAVNKDNNFNYNDISAAFPTALPSTRNPKEVSIIQMGNTDTLQPFTSRVELNIQSYLTTRFFNLRDDFVSELQRILVETDCIEVEVNKFINDLKINLRDILSFELQNLNQINQVMSVVDTICPAFLNVIKSIPSVNTQDRQAETESANLAQVAVSTFSPVLKESFKTMADELSRSINNLHDLQSQIKKNELKHNKQRKILKETLLDYESQKIAQQIESQTVSELSKRISEFRRIYSERDDEDDDGYDDIDSSHNRLTKKLKSAIIRLRKETETTPIEPISRIRAFRRKLNDYREEASSMRNMLLYNNQIFLQRSYQVMAYSQSPVPPPEFISQSQIYNQQPMQHPQWHQQQNLSSSFRYPQQEQPRVSFPGINDDTNVSINSSGVNGNYMDKSSELIDNVRSRLKQIQDKHDADLENISSFLQDLKRNEKQRVRAEIVNE